MEALKSVNYTMDTTGFFPAVGRVQRLSCTVLHQRSCRVVSQIVGFALVAWGIVLTERYKHAWPTVQAVAWLDGVRDGALGNYLPWGMTGDFQPCAHIFVQPAFALT